MAGFVASQWPGEAISLEGTWEPIRRTNAPEVGSVHSGSGRIELRFPLSANPPAEWAQFVDRAWDVEVPSDAPRPPKVAANTILIWSRPAETEFQAWTAGVDKHIEEGNRYYSESVLGSRRQAEEVLELAAAERERLLDEARGWAKRLGPPS